MKRLLANALLYGLAVLLLFPESASRLVGLPVGKIVPFLPLVLYGVLGLFEWEALRAVPRETVQTLAVTYQTMSLTMSGFCFTSIGFLLGYFKEDIKKPGEFNPETILYYFAIALGCFFSSYMTLRFRNRQVFIFLFTALLDNGLWCIALGFTSFAAMAPGLHRAGTVFKTLIVIILIYLGAHFIYSIRFARVGPTGNGDTEVGNRRCDASGIRTNRSRS